MLAGVGVAVAEPAALAAPSTSAGFTTSTTERRDITPGSAVTIQVGVTSSSAREVLVDVEVHDAEWRKVFQAFWDREAFSAGATRTFAATWAVPGDLPAGA